MAVDINNFSTQTLVHIQRVSNHELVDRLKEINNQYLWFQEEEETLWKDIEELHHVNETLTTHKVQEIEELKKAQEELMTKDSKEITKLNK